MAKAIPLFLFSSFDSIPGYRSRREYEAWEGCFRFADKAVAIIEDTVLWGLDCRKKHRRRGLPCELFLLNQAKFDGSLFRSLERFSAQSGFSNLPTANKTFRYC